MGILWLLFGKLSWWNFSKKKKLFDIRDVTNKEICFIRVVFILCKALRYLFARLLTEGKTLFSRKPIAVYAIYYVKIVMTT